MNTRLTALAKALATALHGASAATVTGLRAGLGRTATGLARSRTQLLMLGGVAAIGYGLWTHPPLQTVARGDVGVRTNQFTGSVAEFAPGSVVVLPGLHALRVLPLRDQTYRPASRGEAPFQSVEGLSFGVDMAVRYALDPARVAAMSQNLPADIGNDIVQPAVQGVIYRVFTRYTVREIFSSASMACWISERREEKISRTV